MGAEEGSGLAIFGFCHAVLAVKACARASRPVLASAGGGLDGLRCGVGLPPRAIPPRDGERPCRTIIRYSPWIRLAGRYLPPQRRLSPRPVSRCRTVYAAVPPWRALRRLG